MILMTFVILAAAVVYIAIVMRPESAAELYLNAEKRNFNRILQAIDNKYSSFMAKQEPYLENHYRRRIELTADIEPGIGTFTGKSGFKTVDFIKAGKLVVDTVHSHSDGVSAAEASLLVKKTPFMGMELFTGEGKFFCSIPVLMPDRYFSARLDELDEVYGKLSLPVKPKKLLDNVAIAQVLKFDKSAFTEAAGKMAGIFKKYVTGDDVKYGRDKEVTISGRTFKGKEVIISLSEEAATPLFRELARTAAVGGPLLEYIYGNIAGLSGLLDDAGVFRLLEYLDETGAVIFSDYEKNTISSLRIDKDIGVFAEVLKEAAENYRLSDGFSMALVMDGDKNILERRLTLEVIGTAERDKSSYTLEIRTGNSNTRFEDAGTGLWILCLPSTERPASRRETVGADKADTDRAAPVKTTSAHNAVFRKNVRKRKVPWKFVMLSGGASVTGFDLKLDISKAWMEKLKETGLRGLGGYFRDAEKAPLKY